MSIINKILFRMYNTRIISLQEFIKTNNYLFDKLLFNNKSKEYIKNLDDKQKKEILKHIITVDSVSMKKLNLLNNDKYLYLYADFGFDDTYKAFPRINKIDIDESYIIDSRRPTSCISKLIRTNIDYKPSTNLLNNLSEENLSILYSTSYLNYEIKKDIEKVIYDKTIKNFNGKYEETFAFDNLSPVKFKAISDKIKDEDQIFINDLLKLFNLNNDYAFTKEQKGQLKGLVKKLFNSSNVSLDKIKYLSTANIYTTIVNLRTEENVEGEFELFNFDQLINLNINPVNILSKKIKDKSEEKIKNEFSIALEMYMIFGFTNSLIIIDKIEMDENFLESLANICYSYIKMTKKNQRYVPLLNLDFIKEIRNNPKLLMKNDWFIDYYNIVNGEDEETEVKEEIKQKTKCKIYNFEKNSDLYEENNEDIKCKVYQFKRK